ncbi:MAG: LysM domain-containing protein [Acidimicrobiales bacterium]
MSNTNTSTDQLQALLRAVQRNRSRILGPAALVLLGLGGQLAATHVVAKGDTLTEIARQSGATVEEIATSNGISNPNLIVVGQKLTVPESTDIVWVVQKGDTVYSIAKSQGLTVQAVINRNGLSRSALIREGEHLRIPGSGSADLSADDADDDSNKSDSNNKATEKKNKKKKAAKKKAKRKAAKQAEREAAIAVEPIPDDSDNGEIEPDTGESSDTSDELVPSDEPPATAPAEPAVIVPASPSVTTIYVVQGGDSIASIASLFNIDAQLLANSNGMAVDSPLETGARLLIPNSGNG